MRGDARITGPILRRLRTRAGLSQAQIAAILNLNRATISNMEAGRQRVSPAQEKTLVSALPEWAEAVIRAGHEGIPDVENASFVIEQLTITYVFESSLSPSEILQVRRVRAVRAGVNAYSLGLVRSDGESFTTDTKVLWGGFLDEAPTGSADETMLAVNFGRELRRGEVHEFALRSWVETDAAPDTEIWLKVTVPTDRASVHLAFHGARGARRAWTYEADDELTERIPLSLGLDSAVTMTVQNPLPGVTYGLAWEW